MDAKVTRRDRPRSMRIDGARCLHGGACRLVAPEIDDPDRIAITAATLDAMAARTALMLRPGATPVHPARIGVVETLLGVAWVVALAATLPGAIAGGPA